MNIAGLLATTALTSLPFISMPFYTIYTFYTAPDPLFFPCIRCIPWFTSLPSHRVFVGEAGEGLESFWHFVYLVYFMVHISLRTLRPCASALKHLHLNTATILHLAPHPNLNLHLNLFPSTRSTCSTRLSSLRPLRSLRPNNFTLVRIIPPGHNQTQFPAHTTWLRPMDRASGRY